MRLSVVIFNGFWNCLCGCIGFPLCILYRLQTVHGWLIKWRYSGYYGRSILFCKRCSIACPKNSQPELELLENYIFPSAKCLIYHNAVHRPSGSYSLQYLDAHKNTHSLKKIEKKKFYSQIASKVYREITHTSASYFSSFVRLYMFVYSLSLLRRCSQILLFSHSREIERKTWHCT